MIGSRSLPRSLKFRSLIQTFCAKGKWYDKGVFYTIQKTSVGGRWSWSPDALGASTLGVKMEEPLAGDWLLIGAAELAFNPYSLLLDNGPKSLADNNLDPPTHQTANGNSSRAAQWDNSLGFLGVSSATYGTLTAGRMVSLSNDVAIAYDPTRSNAFSLIGNSPCRSKPSAEASCRLGTIPLRSCRLRWPT